jgi:hypothetical protein
MNGRIWFCFPYQVCSKLAEFREGSFERVKFISRLRNLTDVVETKEIIGGKIRIR